MVEDWQINLYEEAKDLKQRIEALSIFMMGDAFASLDIVDQYVTGLQEKAMKDYLQVLKHRIQRWKV